MKPLPVTLITGFLGAGKTTLVNNLVKHLRDQGQRLALIINEFGKVSIDATVLGSKGASIYEVNQGSIFCVCTREKFIQALSAVVNSPKPYDGVLIEVTGIAETTSLSEYLALPDLKGRLQLQENICLVDAANLHKVLQTLAAVENQVRSASLLVINKLDLVDETRRLQVIEQLRQLNPRAPIIETQYGRLEQNLFNQKHSWEGLEPLRRMPPAAIETITLRTSQKLQHQRLQAFLDSHCTQLLRGKGYVNTELGLHYAELKDDTWTLRLVANCSREESALVLIGSNLDEDALQQGFATCF